MAIVINLDMLLVKNKMSLTELSEKMDISLTNMSLFKTGNIRNVRLESLNKLCKIFNCQPGDILEYVEDIKPKKT